MPFSAVKEHSQLYNAIFVNIKMQRILKITKNIRFKINDRLLELPFIFEAINPMN